MSQYLNLGCGRIIFPLDKEKPNPFPEHLANLPDSCYEPGWVNVDKYPNPGVNETIDLFRFPWIRSSNGNPFNDNSVDEIWASHIIEHIPHQVALVDGTPPNMTREYSRLINNLDGFFVFFAECYRLLKPGGIVHIRCPFGLSVGGIADPTHTRYLVPATFSYLAANGRDTAPFDYHLPMNFEMVVPYNMRFRGRWSEESEYYSAKGIERLLYSQFGVCDELQVTLKAVKETHD